MPISHTGDPNAGFTDTIEYPANGDIANEESVSPLDSLLDNDAFLKAEIEDSETGLLAINARIDALGVLNFPYDTLPLYMTINAAGGVSLQLYDFGHSSAQNQYAALFMDRSNNVAKIFSSIDLKTWVQETHTFATTDDCTDLIVGDSALISGCAFRYNATHLYLLKWVKGTSFTATITALAGAGAIARNAHGGEYFNGTFCWFMWDGANNAIVVTSTDGVNVNRQAFGVTNDLNHIRGPMVCSKSPSILVAIGNTPQNFAVQNNSFFLTTPDAITFTERVFPAVNPGHEIFGGIGYNEENGCFFAASAKCDASTFLLGVTYIYKSVDGINWTLTRTITNIDGNAGHFYYVTALASAGNAILLTVQIENNSSAPHVFLYSPDLGVTWKFFSKLAYGSGTLFDDMPSKLRAGNGQIVHGVASAAGGHVMGSLTMGEQGSAVT